MAACQDISEAFFRLEQLFFHMDYNQDTHQLTAENTARTRLVGVEDNQNIAVRKQMY